MRSHLKPLFKLARLATHVFVLSQIVLLTACVGGGGGGPSATLPTVPGAPDPGVPTLPPTPSLPLPSAAQYQISPALLLTGYQIAHAQGHRGAGVTVAVVDSGFSPAYAEEFGARLLPGFDASLPAGGPVLSDADQMLHGTAMARIIGGSGVWSDGIVSMVGVAPQALIYPVKASNDPSGWMDFIPESLWHLASPAAAAVRIVNMSLGINTEPTLAELNAERAALLPLAALGKLLVVASGNEAELGFVQPSYPARLAADPALASHMLVAGSVTQNKAMSSYSQPAGVTMQRYLVAPAEVNFGTQSNPFFAGGTSNAAAMVSGAAAVVWGRWTYLTADRVATILLETAEDLGAPGVDPVFGRGLVRLDQAMQPRGELLVQSAQGQSVRLGQTVASLPAEALTALRAAGTPVQFRDEWDRHFTFSAASLFTAQPQATATQQRDAVLRDAAPVHQSSEGGVSFSFAGAADLANPLMKLSLQSGRVGANLWRGNLFAPAHFTGSPVMGRFANATGAGASWNFTGAWRGHFHLADGRTLAGQDLGAQSVGLSWGSGNWEMAFHMGAGRAQAATRANASAAGGQGAAMQGAARDERSSAVASVSYGFGQGSNVSFALHQGQQRQQLAQGFGGAVTDADAFVLNWQMRDAGMRGAQLVSSLTLPRSRSTHLSMTLPTGVNMDTGASIYETLNFSSRQRIPARLDLAWSAPVNRSDTLQMGMSASEDDSALSVRWARRF